MILNLNAPFRYFITETSNVELVRNFHIHNLTSLCQFLKLAGRFLGHLQRCGQVSSGAIAFTPNTLAFCLDDCWSGDWPFSS
jgi:hypothetical protein